jgi:hypothetical protein
MLDALVPYQRDGIDTFAFGDLFLEDVRRYRIERLARVGMKALFPIWKRDSREMVRTFSRLGFKAILTCVDTEVLDSSFAGQLIDESFLQRYLRRAIISDAGRLHARRGRDARPFLLLRLGARICRRGNRGGSETVEVFL